MNECDGDRSPASILNCDGDEIIQQKSCDEDGSHTRQQFLETKGLKFGIDNILSSGCSWSNSLNQEHSKSSQVFCPNYGNELFNYYWQYDSGIVNPSSLYYPSVYFSSTPLLSTMRSNRNFFVDTKSEISVGSNTSKRKRIWSRAVFSKLQRKGLENRFKMQKYIMKPDRKQLAAALGLTDSQVKVWFQNRRMKWRNRKENVTQNGSSKS